MDRRRKPQLLLPAIIILVLTGRAYAYQVYYANLHAHTSYSDGVGTPAEAFAYARDVAQIQVQALTEHNNDTPYSQTAEQYDSLRVAATTFTQDGIFVALAGQEIGSLGSDGFGHINVFEASGLDPKNRGDLLGNYEWIRAQNVPAEFNHPYSGSYSNNSIFNNLYYYPTYDEAVDLIEVINGSYVYLDRYIQALNQGWHVGAVGNQDNHQADWGNRVNGNGDIPLTGILADRLDKEGILDALENQRTFAMEVSPASDRISLAFRADGHFMGERFSTASPQVYLDVEVSAATGFRKLDLYRDGLLYRSETLGSPASYAWRVDDSLSLGSHYYFVQATQTDGDRAWSSPIWITVNGEDAGRTIVYCRPNPVRNGAAAIVYSLGAEPGAVVLRVFNPAGEKVWERRIAAPTGTEAWDAVNDRGRPLAAGVYAILAERETAGGVRKAWGKVAVLR